MLRFIGLSAALDHEDFFPLTKTGRDTRRPVSHDPLLTGAMARADLFMWDLGESDILVV